MALLRTVLRGVAVSNKGSTATRTDTGAILLNGGIAANARTVLDLTMYRLPRIEGVATMGTDVSTATITHGTRTGSGREFLTARAALLNGDGNGERRHASKLRMGDPEFLLRNTVASLAEGDQVLQFVCLPVIIKETKRADVMDGMSRCNYSAMLARIKISIARCLSLLIPVWATIAIVSTKPSGIVFTGPRVGLTPFGKAFSVAKVVFTYGAWLLFNGAAACVTNYDNTLPPGAKPVCFLPLAITGKPTEMPFRFVSHIGFSFVDFSALLTR